jgi:biotin carboxyl carrier protein
MATEKEPFQIQVNDTRTVEVTPAQAAQLDMVPDADGRLHILSNGKKYTAEVVETDYAERAFVLKINGTVFRIHIADKYERLIKEMGLTLGSSQKLNELKAPMPGLVLNILVEPGQKVAKGDALLILEAMKMENVLKSPGEATVKSVAVKKGIPVEKGALLMTFE